MKNIICLLTAALWLITLITPINAQTPEPAPTDTLAASESYEGECDGYEPMARYHVTTDVDGLRLRQRPSKDANVVATLPKNTRLIWQGLDADGEVFETTFKDGIPRKGRWGNVSVWKDGSKYGWVFSAALTLVYVQFDAEFGGPLDCLGSSFFEIKSIDSLEFEQRYAASVSKKDKIDYKVLQSPDAQYALRHLDPKKDKMAGLEFIFQETGNNPQKVSLEMVYGSFLHRIAWAKEPGSILLEWYDQLRRGMVYYEFAMPALRL